MRASCSSKRLMAVVFSLLLYLYSSKDSFCRLICYYKRRALWQIWLKSILLGIKCSYTSVTVSARYFISGKYSLNWTTCWVTCSLVNNWQVFRWGQVVPGVVAISIFRLSSLQHIGFGIELKFRNTNLTVINTILLMLPELIKLITDWLHSSIVDWFWSHVESFTKFWNNFVHQTVPVYPCFAASCTLLHSNAFHFLFSKNTSAF